MINAQQKKICLFLIIAIILSSFSFAYNVVVTRDPNAKITVSFNELVSMDMAQTFIKNDLYPTLFYVVSNETSDNMQFTFTSMTALDNGDYTFYFTALDRVGNVGFYQTHFSVGIDETEIILVYPEGKLDTDQVYGYSNITSPNKFNLMVNTPTRPSQCRYGNLDYPFETLILFTSTSTQSSYANYNMYDHYIENFELSEGQRKEIYVKCQDTLGRVKRNRFVLIGDSSAPSIQMGAGLTGAYPNPVIDTPLQTKIKVFTSKDTVCRSQMVLSPADEAKDYWQMTSYSSIFGAEGRNYLEEFDSISEFIAFGLGDKKEYNVTMQCEALNGMMTSKERVTFSVDLSQGLSGELISPPGFTSSKSIYVNFSTNKKSYCYMKFSGFNDGMKERQISYAENPQKNHYYDIGMYDDGMYSLSFRCVSFPDQEKSFTPTFKIDSTPPNMEYVRHDMNITTSRSKLSATFKANDSISDVIEYYYLIQDSYGIDIPNSNWSMVPAESGKETKKTVDGLNLTDLQTYYFVVKANNSAGMVSQELRSDGILVDTSYQQELDKCANGIFEIVNFETDTDCGGSACDKCANGKNCTSSNDCLSKMCLGNVCQEDTCGNGAKDNFETDMDCGGAECAKCADGKNCSINDDCANGYCDAILKTCKSGSCADNATNQDESDKDCGGKCPGCDLGKSCTANTDCKSKYCNKNLQCAISSCSDKEINGEETDADCGGSCPKCIEGKTCKANNDCETGLCQYTKCKAVLQEEPAAVKKKSSILPLIIIFLVLAILGGGGYFYYTNYMQKGASQTAAQKQAGGKTAQSTLVHSQPVIQKPSQSDEEGHKRYMKAQEDKEAKRLDIFRKFGEGPGSKSEKSEKSESIQKSEAKEEKRKVREDRGDKEEGLFIPKKPVFAARSEKITEKKPTASEIFKAVKEEKPAVSKREASDFEKLDKYSKKDSDFDRLGKLKGRGKAEEIKKESNFDRLSSMISKKSAKEMPKPKIEKDIFDRMPSSKRELTSKKSDMGSLKRLVKGEKEDSSFEELGKRIKSRKK